MTTPNAEAEDPEADPTVPLEQTGPGRTGDPLAAFDTILAKVADRDRDTDDRLASQLDAAEHFRAAFADACATEVRPAMEAVIERLRANGGGGVVEQHPGGQARFRSPGLVAWLSLEAVGARSPGAAALGLWQCRCHNPLRQSNSAGGAPAPVAVLAPQPGCCTYVARRV